MAIYRNITTSPTTTVLIPKTNVRTNPSGHKGGISKITIANFSAANPAVVDLYLDDGTNPAIYFFKNVVIPQGTTLVFDDNLDFNTNSFGLKLI